MGGGGRGRRRRKSGGQRRGRSRFARGLRARTRFWMPTRKRAREEEEAARGGETARARTRHRARRVRVSRVLLFSARSPRASACDALRPTRPRACGDGRNAADAGRFNGQRQSRIAFELSSFDAGLVPPDPADATEENFQAPEVDFRLGAAAESSRRASARRAHRLSHLGPSRVRKRRASTRAPSSGPSALPRRPASVRERAPSRWLAR